MKRQSIEKRVADIIESRRQQLNKEIKEWEYKLQGTMSYYGIGGPYNRQEAALELRKQELLELESFARQQSYTVKLQEVHAYVLHCQHCGNVMMSTIQPPEGWHECLYCRKMINIDRPRAKKFRVQDEGQPWLEYIKEGA